MKYASTFSISLILVASTLAAQTPAPVGSPPQNPLNTLVTYLAAKYLPSALIAPVTPEAVAQSAANQVNQDRSDQQLTAPPGVGAATSITEKAGVADLLAVAIERGAITKTNNGNAVTLSTTPYQWLMAFGTPDTNSNWQKYSHLRRLSLTSTFSSNDVTKGDFTSFAGGEVKYVFYGDRSARDIKNVVDLVGAKEIARQVNALDEVQFSACSQPLLGKLGELGTKALIAAGTSKAALDVVFASYTPTADVLATLSACTTTIATQEAVDRAVGAHLKTIIGDYLKQSNKVQLSLAGLFTRDATLSDFYTVKLLGDYNPAAGTVTAGDSTNPMWTANFNGVVDFNQRSRAADGTALRQVRSYSVELAANTPRFGQGLLEATFSATGTRTKDAGAKSLVVGEGKLNVHLNKTFTLPVAVSYTSNETSTAKKGFQFNIGFSALLDKLMSGATAPK